MTDEKEFWGYIDAHCHLNDEKFCSDIQNVLDNMRKNRVSAAIVVGSGCEDSKRAVELAHTYDNLYAAVGFHPHEASLVNDKALAQIEKLAQDEKVVGYGEVGLDFHYDFSPRDVQCGAVKEQVALAKSLDLPLIIHEREAFSELFSILEETGGLSVGGHWHCITTELKNALEIAKYFYIGITGIVTFSKSENVREIVENIPLNSIILETDAPYLAPKPYRGKRNEPSYIPIIAEKVAEIKGISLENVERISWENTLKVYPKMLEGRGNCE